MSWSIHPTDILGRDTEGRPIALVALVCDWCDVTVTDEPRMHHDDAEDLWARHVRDECRSEQATAEREGA